MSISGRIPDAFPQNVNPLERVELFETFTGPNKPVKISQSISSNRFHYPLSEKWFSSRVLLRPFPTSSSLDGERDERTNRRTFIPEVRAKFPRRRLRHARIKFRRTNHHRLAASGSRFSSGFLSPIDYRLSMKFLLLHACPLLYSAQIRRHDVARNANADNNP